MEPNLTRCPKCQAQISIEQWQPEVVNTERLSIASLAHDLGIDCPSCGEYLIPAIQSINLEVGLIVHPRPPRALRIVTASAVRIPTLAGLKLQ